MAIQSSASVAVAWGCVVSIRGNSEFVRWNKLRKHTVALLVWLPPSSCIYTGFSQKYCHWCSCHLCQWWPVGWSQCKLRHLILFRRTFKTKLENIQHSKLLSMCNLIFWLTSFFKLDMWNSKNRMHKICK